MPRLIHLHDPVERFVVGTIGLPGERTFFVQARTDSRVTSVVLEKGQVSMLTERLAEFLGEIGERFDVTVPPPGPVDTDPLEVPLIEEFRVAAIAFGWDPLLDQMLFELHGPGEDDVDPTDLADSDEGPPMLRVRARISQVVAFIERAKRVITAGRPPCPICEQPLDPGGHLCPRANGYRR